MGPGELQFFAAVLVVASLVCWGFFADALTTLSFDGDAGYEIDLSVGLLLAGGVVTIVLAAAALVVAEIRTLAPPGGAGRPGAAPRPPRGPQV